MARGGRAAFNIEYSKFSKSLEVLLSKVERGTKKATRQACEEILAESLRQVPKDTNTLAKSAFYEIHGKYRNFTATIGYGGNGDPINPKTGRPASDYMVVVHEDLQAHHPVGKAKFLEDPVREYQRKMRQTYARAIRKETGM
ncbi:MAG: hypothetical protein GX664_03895 [Bacteroidales bacterium]|nr:hypothetical protein [Bacteroidales bacterium]